MRTGRAASCSGLWWPGAPHHVGETETYRFPNGSDLKWKNVVVLREMVEVELQRGAQEPLTIVVAAVGGPGDGVQPHRQRDAQDGKTGLRKGARKMWRHLGRVIPPRRNADFATAMEQVPDTFGCPCDLPFPAVRMDETPRTPVGETRLPVLAVHGEPAREDDEHRRYRIGRLPGDAQVETAARYAHLGRHSVKEAAAKVAGSIGADFYKHRETDGEHLRRAGC